MWVANGNKEKSWDAAMEIAQDISRVTNDFKWNVEPPKFRKDNSSGVIQLQTPINLILRGKLKENITKLMLLAEEVELRSPSLWIMRWRDVYYWDDSLHANDDDDDEC